jgi:hypothetical protein
MPASLANRPGLDDSWKWPYNVWLSLSGTRPFSEAGHSMLSFSEVALYGLVHGCTRLEIVDLWYDLSRIDKAWDAEVTKIRKESET